MTDNDIPTSVVGFKRTRPHSFLHLKTHVEVEVLSPDYLNIPKDLFKKVSETAEITSGSFGIKTASPNGIAALKLFRGSLKDLGDIEGLIEAGNHIDLTDWPIPEECWKKVQPLIKEYKLNLRRN